MKILIVFLCFLCAFKFVSAQEYWDICKGETFYWNVAVNSTDTVIYFSSFTDSISYLNNRLYDTIVGDILSATVDTDMIYEVVSVNGIPPVYQKMLVITILPIPTISIPLSSIHHVTCPDGYDGYLYPYADGSFHVGLDNPVSDYDWIDIFNDSTYYYIQVHDSVTLTGLRSGTYYVTAHGINGCDYTDSVVIEQPDPWVWIEDSLYVDTVCVGQTGCTSIAIYGGTPPYNFTWFYWEYTENGIDTIFLPDTTQMVCDLSAGGRIYFVYMYDSRGCKAWGEEMEVILTYLYEYVEDSTHIITIDSIACYGGDFLVQAQSIGLGTYTWYVGDVADSVNYWTSIYGDSMFVADYYTPQITEPTWVYAEFSDQHHCVTRDSIWVEVYNPDVSMNIVTTQVVTDSSCTVHVSPPGGNLYLDDVLISYNIPENYTFSTTGISVGEHTLKYAGIFGAEMGLACEDEISIPIQVETNPFVQDWEYNISIYPNPATTTLNLSSTGVTDFGVSILDITGKVIKSDRMSENVFTFDVSDLSSGIYMLRLVSHDGASKVVKFVKK